MAEFALFSCKLVFCLPEVFRILSSRAIRHHRKTIHRKVYAEISLFIRCFLLAPGLVFALRQFIKEGGIVFAAWFFTDSDRLQFPCFRDLPMDSYPHHSYLRKSYLLLFDADVPVHHIGRVALSAVVLRFVPWMSGIFSHPVVAEACFKFELCIAQRERVDFSEPGIFFLV